MSPLIILFTTTGCCLLFINQYTNAIAFFVTTISIYLVINLIQYAKTYALTNQFIDGQQTAIEEYNEDTKS